MLTAQIADLLRTARKALHLSQAELAHRAGVSARLWAEVERGQRPNVSLETALRMLGEVGVTVRLTDPMGTSRELRNPHAEAAARAARAEVRRTTWHGRKIRLHDEGNETDDISTIARGAARLAAVAHVSEQAFAVARAPRVAPVHGAPAQPGRNTATPSVTKPRRKYTD